MQASTLFPGSIGSRGDLTEDQLASEAKAALMASQSQHSAEFSEGYHPTPYTLNPTPYTLHLTPIVGAPPLSALNLKS